MSRYPRVLYTKQNLTPPTLIPENMSLIRQPMPEISGVSKFTRTAGHPVEREAISKWRAGLRPLGTVIDIIRTFG